MLFIVKPTAACNGACRYCSAYKEHTDELGRMSLEQVRAILNRVEEFALSSRPRRLTILWHGGEPFLMGAQFYREVMEICSQMFERTGLEIGHIMQSNITMATDELADVLRDLLKNKRLGSSYDPIPDIRLLKDGSSYEEKWRAGYKKLKEHNVGVGVVYVAHKQSLGRAAEIYHHFKDMGFEGGLRFNPLYAAGLARESDVLHITPEQWGEFLVDLWKVWNEDGRSIRVDPFVGLSQAVEGAAARMSCAFSGRCTEGFTGVKCDGSVYSCGRSMDDNLLCFGNIYDRPLADILESPNRRAFLNRIEWLQHGECAGCRWWSFCHGGCPNDAHLGHGNMLRRTYWCEGRRLFLDRVFGKRLAGMVLPEPTDHEDILDPDEPDAPGSTSRAES